MPGEQGGRAGEGRQIPGRAVQPERRGETALPDGPAIKGRNTPARLPPRFPAPGKCTSHLGFGLGPRYKTDHRLQTTRRPHRRDQVERTLARAHHPLLHRGPQTRPGVEGHHCTAPSARRPPPPLPGLELRGPQSTGIASPCQQTTPQNQRTSHHRDLSSSHRRVHFRDHHHRRHKHHQIRASTEAANALTIQPLAPKPTNKTWRAASPYPRAQQHHDPVPQNAPLTYTLKIPIHPRSEDTNWANRRPRPPRPPRWLRPSPRSEFRRAGQTDQCPAPRSPRRATGLCR